MLIPVIPLPVKSQKKCSEYFPLMFIMIKGPPDFLKLFQVGTVKTRFSETKDPTEQIVFKATCTSDNVKNQMIRACWDVAPRIPPRPCPGTAGELAAPPNL